LVRDVVGRDVFFLVVTSFFAFVIFYRISCVWKISACLARNFPFRRRLFFRRSQVYAASRAARRQRNNGLDGQVACRRGRVEAGRYDAPLPGGSWSSAETGFCVKLPSPGIMLMSTPGSCSKAAAWSPISEKSRPLGQQPGAAEQTTTAMRQSRHCGRCRNAAKTSYRPDCISLRSSPREAERSQVVQKMSKF